jgi:hypothetical protein
LESKTQLIGENNILKARMKKMYCIIQDKNAQLRQYRFHLQQLKKKIDYIVEHPWSTGSGLSGRKRKTTQ